MLIEQDKSEKRPIIFPEWVNGPNAVIPITTKEVAMRTGDYRLAAHPRCCVIERKGRPEELYECFLGGAYKRVCGPDGQLDRLKECAEYPVLVIDTGPSDVLNADYKRHIRGLSGEVGGLLVGKIMEECFKRKISVVWAGRIDSPARQRAMGELVVWTLLAAIR